MGGIGKTRLADAAARRISDSFADGTPTCSTNGPAVRKAQTATAYRLRKFGRMNGASLAAATPADDDFDAKRPAAPPDPAGTLALRSCLRGSAYSSRSPGVECWRGRNGRRVGGSLHEAMTRTNSRERVAPVPRRKRRILCGKSPHRAPRPPGKPSKSGSQWTRRWSKPDSNPRSHPLTRRQTHGSDRMNGAERDTVVGSGFAGDSRSRSHQT